MKVKSSHVITARGNTENYAFVCSLGVSLSGIQKPQVNISILTIKNSSEGK